MIKLTALIFGVSTADINENLVGSYKIKGIRIRDRLIDIGKGKLSNDHPMVFFEHNSQFVLSIEDTIYKGRYVLDKNESIRVYLDNSTKFRMTSISGSLKGNAINGKIDDNRSFEMIFERIDGSKDYLNELYN